MKKIEADISLQIILVILPKIYFFCKIMFVNFKHAWIFGELAFLDKETVKLYYFCNQKCLIVSYLTLSPLFQVGVNAEADFP